MNNPFHNITPPPDWHELALCRQVDPQLWFPEPTDDAQVAKTICRRCPAQAECLADALDREEPHGIWGGHSARQRRRILKHRGAAA